MRGALFTRIPQLREGRWRLLQDAVADWFPPLAPADGYSGADLSSAELRLARSLPHALSEWYRLAGRRADIWSRQDCLLAPEELMICADHLVFYLENQAVVSWGIKLSDLDLADPPVYVQSVDDAAIWIQENPTVSEFALQMYVLCIQFGEPLRWICGFPDQELSVLIVLRQPDYR